MIRKKLKRSNTIERRLLGALAGALCLVLIAGCVVAIPVIAYNYYVDMDKVSWDMEVDMKASDLYDTLVRATKKKRPDIEVIVDDREKLIFQAKVIAPERGHEYLGGWEVEPIDENMSKLYFYSRGKEGDEDIEIEELKTIGDNALDTFCKEIGRRCKRKK
jgi:hypothetical protein